MITEHTKLPEPLANLTVVSNVLTSRKPEESHAVYQVTSLSGSPQQIHLGAASYSIGGKRISRRISNDPS